MLSVKGNEKYFTFQSYAYDYAQKSKYRQSWNDLQKEVCMEPAHQELFVWAVCVHMCAFMVLFV